jgi:NTP pyrophosphatase (non-canonical NTP hydrolase)
MECGVWMSLTFDELRKANLKRLPDFKFQSPRGTHGLYEWSPTDWGCALAGETGELCNKLKKLRRGEPIQTQEIANEIADVQIYLDLLAQRLKINLGQATVDKFNRKSREVGSEIML